MGRAIVPPPALAAPWSGRSSADPGEQRRDVGGLRPLAREPLEERPDLVLHVFRSARCEDGGETAAQRAHGAAGLRELLVEEGPRLRRVAEAEKAAADQE